MSNNYPTAKNGKVRADKAGFTPHVDLGHVPAGTEFQVTWSFKNEGVLAWDASYRLAFTTAEHSETAAFDRSPIGAPEAVAIGDIGAPAAVGPAEVVHLRMTFKAPDEPGLYATNWQLQHPQGEFFGPVRWLRAVVVAADVPEEEGTLDVQFVDFKNSVANFESMQPGREFSATWVLRNSGTAPWKGDFQVAYVDEATASTADKPRSQMGIDAVSTLQGLTGRERVNPGEDVTIPFKLVAPTQAGAYALHWQLRDEQGQPFGDVRWLAIGVKGVDHHIPTTTTQAVQFGMNVNIQPGGHPTDEQRMKGLGWVRWVFWASRENWTPAEAYQKRYRAIIQAYASQGIRSLIILHQDTYWGNAPWDHGGWEAYAKNFGKQCGQVAAVCKEFGDMVAYQIYNETDSGFGNDAGNPNISAIGIEPGHYALILAEAAKEIRAADAQATVIFGGMKTGPGNSINYIKDVQARISGDLPVDAIAYHPYGRFVHTPIFNFGNIGRLSDALQLFKNAFANEKLWITEVGVASDGEIGPQHYETVATYMREVVNDVRDNHASQVPVLIWFGWTDLMRNAGMNTIDNKPKAHIYEVFEEMRIPAPALPAADLSFATPEEASKAVFISYNSTLSNLNAVPAGSEFTSRWTFRNNGTSTWGAGFTLNYAAMGENPAPMTDRKSYPLSEVMGQTAVVPGQQVTIALELTAPKVDGRTYRSHWQLRDEQGETFAFLYEELTVVPKSTTGSGARKVGMKHVRDQTIPDDTRLVAGTDFDKQWLVENTGDRHWGSGFRLVFIEGDLHMARGEASHLVPNCKPGERVTLSIPMTAPPVVAGQPAVYRSLWRLEDDHGNKFGDQIWVRIVSVDPLSTTPEANTPLARLLNDPASWYSQLDPSWQGTKLGHGEATIGSWGCLMTCMAMALTAYEVKVTPPELNEKAKEHGVFSGSAILFHAPGSVGQLKFKMNVKSWPDADVDHAVWTGEDPIQRIDEALAEGNIVVAQVDTKPNNGFYNSDNEQHWVVIVKRTPDGKDYMMIDPLTPPKDVNTQPRSLMIKYGSADPNESNETNLRNAIKSTLVYHKPGAGGS